ncbi:MAG: hypothetical protein ACPKPY_05820 [Nitrososphaeraceae archaeon]
MSGVSYLSSTNQLREQQLSIHCKYPHSDIWICDNCNDDVDKWYMKVHHGRYNNKKHMRQ